MIEDTVKPSCLSEKLISKHAIVKQFILPGLGIEPRPGW